MERYENFGFVKEYSPDLYNKLSNVEKLVKTDPEGAIPKMRKPFEGIVSVIMNNNGLEISDDDDLNAKIKKIQDINWVRNYNNKPINYINIYGDEKRAKRLNFIRWLLNSSVHDVERDYWPRVDSVNAMKGLQGLHTLAKRTYIGGGNTDIRFDEYYCPIKDYYIYDSYVPSDARRSLCKREYRGVLYNTSGTKIDKYAVIREYDTKSGEDETFRLRNEECFHEASKYLIGSAPAYMADTNAIKTEDGVDAYYISYNFKQEPHSLTNKILAEMDHEAKLSFCKGLATCLSQLHSSDTPIYHRLLSSESIYVCKIKNDWIPYIIKFDCAKIDAGDAIATVIKYWEKVKERQDQRIEIYQPPECKSGDAPDDIDWSKVDIYSLGMLMACIFSGDLTREVKALRKLKSLGCSMELLSLIDNMISDSPEMRPSIDEVMERLA